jgi:hypothetical protein
MALGRLLPGGNKIFHPYNRQLPSTRLGWVRLVLGSGYRELWKWCRRQLGAAIR